MRTHSENTMLCMIGMLMLCTDAEQHEHIHRLQ